MRSTFASLALGWFVSSLWAQVPADSPRMTPVVKVIADIEPAVVALFTVDEEHKGYASGSGTIIHPDGYVLTNNHILPATEGYALVLNKPCRFAVVGRLPEKDIALLRLLNVSGTLPTVPLGHSHDVMNGESIVVAGNPGGRGVVFTTGIVSSKRVLTDAPNALVMTQFADSRRDDFIQFDAASNRGNSGGPLVNMEGDLIGVVSALIPQEQNVGFAIPVDRVREQFEHILEPELIYERATGVQLNPQADQAIVASVVPGSAAARSSLQPGDAIVSVGGRELRHAADWTMTLHQRLPSGKPLELIAQRAGKTLPIKLTPQRKPPLTPVDAESVKPGLAFKFYHGRYNLLPDFETLEPHRTGIVKELDLDEIRGQRDDEFAVDLEGLVKIEQDGLYRLTIISDDGSRVYLHEELLIDHDGNHPPTPASRLLRAKAGLHPIRIQHYEGIGAQTLEMRLERFGQKQDVESKLEFFHEPS